MTESQPVSGCLGMGGMERQDGGITKVNEETLGGDGYVQYRECGEGFIGVYVYVKTYICALKYEQFILCPLCLD